MCGIVGVIKQQDESISIDDYNSFLEMLIQAESRGRQATGIAYLFNDYRTGIIKSAAEASQAFAYVPYRTNVRAMIGHTRFGTGGPAKYNYNNHPHESADWVLIHNGMCDTELPKEKLSCISDCDTEYFVQGFEYTKRMSEHKDSGLLDKALLPKIIKDTLSNMSGSWSLCFIHKSTGRIFLTTNGGSPLAIVKTEKALYFASLAEYFVSSKIIEDVSSAHIFGKTEENVLYEVIENNMLIDCGKYTPKEKEYIKYNNYNSYRNRDRLDYYDDTDPTWTSPSVYKGHTRTGSRENAMFDFKDKTKIKTAKNNLKKETIKIDFRVSQIDDYELEISKPIFSLKTQKLYTALDERPDYKNSVISLLAYCSDYIDINEHLARAIENTAEDGTGMPKSVKRTVLVLARKNINEAINDYIDIKVLATQFCNELWDIIKDDCTINDIVFSKFTIHEIILIALYGVEIMKDFDIFSSSSLFELDNELLVGDLAGEPSEIGCVSCGLPRNSIIIDDKIYYMCDKCSTVLVEYL